MATKRNIVTCIILSIVTCGIYMLYWMVKMNDEAKAEANTSEGASGIMLIILCIVTCGIYEFYWYFKMGQRMKAAGDNNGVGIEDRGVIYLIVALVGFGIVNICLIQNDLNTIADSKSMA